MRKLIAIVCLTAFFALQYGKLISYWHCRLINISSAAPCDCVKQLLDVHKENTKHSTASLKEKTEEIVLFHEAVQQPQSIPTICFIYTTAFINVVPQTYQGSIFQPPRIS